MVRTNPMFPAPPNPHRKKLDADRACSRLQARAFEIADESMVSLVQCQCLRVDETGCLWSPTNNDGREVVSVEDADPAIVNAVEYLKGRGLCEVIDSPDGEVILLIGEEVPL